MYKSYCRTHTLIRKNINLKIRNRDIAHISSYRSRIGELYCERRKIPSRKIFVARLRQNNYKVSIGLLKWNVTQLYNLYLQFLSSCMFAFSLNWHAYKDQQRTSGIFIFRLRFKIYNIVVKCLLACWAATVHLQV